MYFSILYRYAAMPRGKGKKKGSCPDGRCYLDDDSDSSCSDSDCSDCYECAPKKKRGKRKSTATKSRATSSKSKSKTSKSKGKKKTSSRRKREFIPFRFIGFSFFRGFLVNNKTDLKSLKIVRLLLVHLKYFKFSFCEKFY